ncbi:exodeoxyribonuclease III-like [Aethina tumida]|uniref:exodeoxyribonuclease III-like n=1 Tax=Aethina tumida TaxID=116153 RepID=UPI0021496D49|nr:exodeoxyribonuclease III-like [Aethina tumida]
MSSSGPGSIAVLSWNVNGFKTRRMDLEDLKVEHSPDVLCLQETKTPSDSRMALLGYNVYRYDRDTPYGGVAILIRPGVAHCFLGTDSGITMDNIFIELSTVDGPVKITSLQAPATIARPRGHPVTGWIRCASDSAGRP